MSVALLVTKPFPRKMAVIFVAPGGRDESAIEAVPATTGMSPTITFPVLNRTLPTGAPPIADTDALKVTDSPTIEGFSDEVSAVDVGSLTPRWIAPIARKLEAPLKRIEPTALFNGRPIGVQMHIL